MGIENGSGRGRFFLTMELLVGTSLADRIDQGRPTPGGGAADRGADRRRPRRRPRAGVIHRDLKPGNIMLLPPPTGRFEQRAVITDFGLALSEDQSEMRLTQSDELVGTPEYMAPEQAEPAPATPAADIYALGLILYEMLSSGAPSKRPAPRWRRCSSAAASRRVPCGSSFPTCRRRGQARSTAAWNAIRRAGSRAPARSSPPSVTRRRQRRVGSQPRTGFFGRLTRKLR